MSGRRAARSWRGMKAGQEGGCPCSAEGREKARLMEMAAEKNARFCGRTGKNKRAKENEPSVQSTKTGELSGFNGPGADGGFRYFQYQRVSIGRIHGSLWYGQPKRARYRNSRSRLWRGQMIMRPWRRVLTRGDVKAWRGKGLGQEGRPGLRPVSGYTDDGRRKGTGIRGRRCFPGLGLNIPVCGMVKDDNHRTRGLYYNNGEVPIDRHSEGFRPDHQDSGPRPIVCH